MKKNNTFYFCIGLILGLSECWKQWCLTWQLNQGVYQWWYFPFQLCSIPMYLCLLLPLFKQPKIRQIIFSFLSDFCLLSGIFAFFDTSGMHYDFFPLTVHSFTWHVLLIIIGIAAGRSLENTLQWTACAGSILLYLICCSIATLCNLLLQPIGNINLFYISPLHPMNQVVFSDLAAFLGNSTGIFLYIASTIFGAILFHVFWRILRVAFPKYFPCTSQNFRLF
ncbi:MAG: YwaF family protein [Hespellia sp.]|nr:YwaF family protein [Hespellia sp.]